VSTTDTKHKNYASLNILIQTNYNLINYSYKVYHVIKRGVYAFEICLNVL